MGMAEAAWNGRGARRSVSFAGAKRMRYQAQLKHP
jgi:hypothetical protein